MLTAMGNFNEELVKAGIMLAGEGLHPSVEGQARAVLGREAHGDRRSVRRDQGAGRRLLAVAGEVDGGSGRVGEALPEPDARSSPRSRSGRSSRRRTSAPSSRPSCARRRTGCAPRSRSARSHAGIEPFASDSATGVRIQTFYPAPDKEIRDADPALPVLRRSLRGGDRVLPARDRRAGRDDDAVQREPRPGARGHAAAGLGEQGHARVAARSATRP